jgi:hypothetical protein
MTAPNPIADDDPIVVDLDDDAIPLSDLAPAEAGPRALAVLALQEQMASIGLNLPLGPSLHLNDPVRLLVLNGFRVQLVEAPYGADLLHADAGPWQQTAGAPHFLLAAWVDEDLQVVRFPGVLTHDEVGRLAKTGAKTLALPLEGFRGGVDRLLSLVQLLDPQTMALRGLAPIPIGRWLQGMIDDGLLALGARLQPPAGVVFRHGGGSHDSDGDALAVLAIPLGVVGDSICWGEARAGAVERFQLQLIPFGEGDSGPNRLRVRLLPQLAGDVLPDGLRLVAGPRAAVSALSQGLELEVEGTPAAIQIAVEWKGEQLRLPPLLLPPAGAQAPPHADR